MKNLHAFLLLAILSFSCATSNRMNNKAIHYAIVGQTEATVYKRLGIPARIVPAPDGEKLLIYEYYDKGMFINPNKSKLTFNYEGDMINQEPHLNWKYTSINTKTNAPEYKIYQEEKSQLEVHLNREGQCIGFRHNLSKNQMELLFEQFRKYIPDAH